MDDGVDSVFGALTYYVALTLMFGSTLVVLVIEAVACFRQWRSRRDKSLAVDRPDVPYYYYQRLPGEEDDRCVVCLAEYEEQGEGRFVLPRCAHAFHRACIAPWLRQGTNTCPICRATAAVVNPATADNMV